MFEKSIVRCCTSHYNNNISNSSTSHQLLWLYRLCINTLYTVQRNNISTIRHKQTLFTPPYNYIKCTILQQYNVWKNLLAKQRDQLTQQQQEQQEQNNNKTDNTYTNKLALSSADTDYHLRLIQQSTTSNQLYQSCMCDIITLNHSYTHSFTAIIKLAQIVKNDNTISMPQLDSVITLLQISCLSGLQSNKLNRYIGQALIFGNDILVDLLCKMTYSCSSLIKFTSDKAYNITTKLRFINNLTLAHIQELLCWHQLQHNQLSMLLQAIHIAGHTTHNKSTSKSLLANIINCTIHQLQYNSDTLTIDSLTTYITIYSQLNIQHNELWQLLSQYVLNDKLLQTSKTIQLCNILYSYTLLDNITFINIEYKARLCITLCSIILYNLHTLTTAQLSNLVYSLSYYYTKHTVVKDVLISITRILIHRQNNSNDDNNNIKQLQQQALLYSNTVYILHNNLIRGLLLTAVTHCKLNIYNAQLWQYIANNVSDNSIEHIDTYTLCSIYWSIIEQNVLLQYSNIDKLLQAIIQQLHTRVVDENRKKGITNNTYIRLCTATIIRLYNLRTVQHNDVDTTHIKQLANILQCCIDNINSNDTMYKNVEQYKQLHIISLSLHCMGLQNLFSNTIALNDELQATCYEKYIDMYISAQGVSLQNLLFTRLDRVGIDVTHNWIHRPSGLHIDAVVHTNKNINNDMYNNDSTSNNMKSIDVAMIIEPRQSYYTIINDINKTRYSITQHLNASVLLRHQLIERLTGYRINIIPYHSLTNHVITSEKTKLNQYELTSLNIDL